MYHTFGVPLRRLCGGLASLGAAGVAGRFPGRFPGLSRPFPRKDSTYRQMSGLRKRGVHLGCVLGNLHKLQGHLCGPAAGAPRVCLWNVPWIFAFAWTPMGCALIFLLLAWIFLCFCMVSLYFELSFLIRAFIALVYHGSQGFCMDVPGV